MTRRIGWALVLAGVTACGSSRSAPRQPEPQLDIWDLAPPDAYLAVGSRYGDWWELLERAEMWIADAPGGETQRAFLGAMLSYPRVPMRSEAARRKTGIDDDGPLVEFFTRRGPLHVYRVIDRAAYVRTFGSRPDRASRGRIIIDGDGDHCAPIGRFQACGPREVLVDLLAGKRFSIAWPAARTPTVRIWASPSFLGGLGAATTGGDGLRVEVDVGRGEIRARAHLSGAPGPILATFATAGPSPLARRLPAADLSGAAVLNLSGWFQRTREQMIASSGDDRLTPKVSKADLFAALRGDAVLWAVRGDRGGGIAVGFDRIDVARRLVADCEELAERVPSARFARQGDSCRIQHPMLRDFGTDEIVVRVRDDALVGELSGGGKASPAPRRGAADLLERVRTGDDGVAVWGSGVTAKLARANLARQAVKADPFYLWTFLQLSEIGGILRIDPDGIHGELSIRTAASYEQPEQAALAPLTGRLARGESVEASAFDRLTSDHARGRLAVDLAEGNSGLVVPVVASIFVGAGAVSLVRELSAMSRAGAEVVSAYEDVVEKACSCKDADCAEKAVERHDEWTKRHGETVVDPLTLSRIGELTREYETCLAPFASAEEGE